MNYIHSTPRLVVNVLDFAPGMVKVISSNPECTWLCTHFVTADKVIVGDGIGRYRKLSATQIADARKLIPA